MLDHAAIAARASLTRRATLGEAATSPPSSSGVLGAMLGAAVGVTMGYWGSSAIAAPPNAVIGGTLGGIAGYLLWR